MLRQFNENHVSTSLGIYRVPKELRKKVVNSLYLPHLKKLEVMESKLRNQGFGFSCFNSHRDYSNAKKLNIRENNESFGFEDGELIPFKTTS